MEPEQFRGEEINTRGAGRHTGEVEVHSGDITGIAVHVGVRVAARA